MVLPVYIFSGSFSIGSPIIVQDLLRLVKIARFVYAETVTLHEVLLIRPAAFLYDLIVRFIPRGNVFGAFGSRNILMAH